VVILDEYDAIMEGHPFHVHDGGLNGMWQFAGRLVIAFTATSSPQHERLVSNTIGLPKVLRFKSEYELVNGTSPI